MSDEIDYFLWQNMQPDYGPLYWVWRGGKVRPATFRGECTYNFATLSWVAYTIIGTKNKEKTFHVSTVFLPIQVGFRRDDPDYLPCFWETQVWSENHNGERENDDEDGCRYREIAAARAGHQEFVEAICATQKGYVQVGFYRPDDPEDSGEFPEEITLWKLEDWFCPICKEQFFRHKPLPCLDMWLDYLLYIQNVTSAVPLLPLVGAAPPTSLIRYVDHLYKSKQDVPKYRFDLPRCEQILADIRQTRGVTAIRMESSEHGTHIRIECGGAPYFDSTHESLCVAIVMVAIAFFLARAPGSR